MQLNCLDNNAATVDLAASVFDVPFKEPLIHQIVNAYMAAGRAGTAAQKTRSEVRGGGKKPWKQKGTGRARAGTIRSPIWRGGGVVFAAKPRDYKQKVNRKMYQGAMRSIFSELVRQQRLKLIDAPLVSEAKTKQLRLKLESLQITGNVLIVTDHDVTLERAASNIPTISVIHPTTVNPVDLIRVEHVIIMRSVFSKLQEQLQ